MSSIILKSAGTVIGGAVGGPVGSALGGALGQVVGGIASGSGGGRKNNVQGPRLAELSVQTSTYGKMIPVVYGTVRIAGNVIWSRPITETAVTTRASARGGKGGGGRVSQTATDYVYSVSLAVGVCEGEITEFLRVWADAKPLDLSQYSVRFYTGSETQLPDSFIESFEGVGATPAYRGLAYAVIEDFPLADYGNRIPNFTFEVKRKLQSPDYDGQVLENLITGVNLIPGSGEFVYDTNAAFKIAGEQAGAGFAQNGARVALNQHTPFGKANALVALDQLQETLPNVEWVGVVATWFGDALDAGACVVKPGVEYQTGGITTPQEWSVAGFTRATARQITLEGGSPRYGGTPDDASLLRLLDELRARGYKILFLPMFFMDVSGKPWRGRVTGSAANVTSFFTKTNGYNAFVTHYANLVHAKVDAFAIGSELVGLTKVTDTPGNYPGVNALVSLAATVKGIVGSGVKVTYAADWSEYHHTDGGWYNLDPLWASSNIDVVGIDAYFPLTNAPQSDIDFSDMLAGWTSGEGYDFYYTDPARTTQASLSAPYAWKNIAWWWNNTHTNPGGAATAWVPGSKPIWFTEYGFPSIDGATNQPNIFYDPNSTESGFPYYSKGRVDARAQRLGLLSAEVQWAGSAMVQQKFVWTWDARPYPYWPDLTSIWRDGASWKFGHWMQGKLGLTSVSAVVAELCARGGFAAEDIDVSNVSGMVDGFVITTPQTLREGIEQLMAGYFFDAVERAGVLHFVPRGGNSVVTISEDALAVPKNAEALRITRAQEMELPQRVNMVYLNREAAYQPSTQIAQRSATPSQEVVTVNLPLVLPDQLAKTIADVTLFNAWVGRIEYSFSLPVQYAALEPTDVMTITAGAATHVVRVTDMRQDAGVLRVRGVADEPAVYDFYTAAAASTNPIAVTPPVGETRLEFLDIPALPQDNPQDANIRFAARGVGQGWRGAVLFRSDDAGANYAELVNFSTPSIIGTAVDALASGAAVLFDETGSVTVTLLGDAELASATELGVLNGANIAVLGNEIFQFQTAILLAPTKYRLSRLLRGRLGTEWAMASHAAGERFVLLSDALGRDGAGRALIGLSRAYKPVSVGATLGATSAQNFTYGGAALKPYAPVQLAGSRDGSGNLTITWLRRTRGGGAWVDYVDVPLNETAEAYEIEVLNGASVVRTISVSSATASYSAAQQVADFGSAQASISVRVYQMSGSVGRGYAAVGSV